MNVLEDSIRSSCEELLTANEALFTAFFDDCPVTTQSVFQPEVVVESQPPVSIAPPPSPPHPVTSKPQAEEEDEDEFFFIVCSIKQVTSCRSTSTSPLPLYSQQRTAHCRLLAQQEKYDLYVTCKCGGDSAYDHSDLDPDP